MVTRRKQSEATVSFLCCIPAMLISCIRSLGQKPYHQIGSWKALSYGLAHGSCCVATYLLLNKLLPDLVTESNTKHPLVVSLVCQELWLESSPEATAWYRQGQMSPDGTSEAISSLGHSHV